MRRLLMEKRKLRVVDDGEECQEAVGLGEVTLRQQKL